MKIIQQIKWWLHATWLMPLLAVCCAILANIVLGWRWMTIQWVILMVFASICVAWWFWVMGTVKHIISTYARVETKLDVVSDQLTDIKRELGSIREHNY